MLCDYHVHTEFSGDCDTPARRQIEQAIRLGMPCVCITDHHDYDVEYDMDFTLDFEPYFETLSGLKEEYAGRIQLRIGVELGLQTWLADYVSRLLSRHPFDFVIGSTHFLDNVDPGDSESGDSRFFSNRTERQAYLAYFEAQLGNIKAVKDFDVAGHIDYVVRYGPNANRFFSYEEYREALDPILRALVENGKGIECNSAGYRKGLGQPNPDPEILKRYRQLGGEIVTVGSDAHRESDLAADFDRVRGLLIECGFTHYATFRERKPEFHRL